jgi:ADP-ribose pyrophosphatase
VSTARVSAGAALVFVSEPNRQDNAMALSRWKKLTDSVRFTNKWWLYKFDTFELPSGKSGEYHYVHTNGSSMVVPVLNDGRILMVNQYRYLADRESLEFPCGSVKDGSTYDQTAWQELAEETGHSSDRMARVGEFNPYNGVTDEMCHVYIARELHPASREPDETEEFEVVALDASGIDEKIRMGQIWDGMTIAAWCIVKAATNGHLG